MFKQVFMHKGSDGGTRYLLVSVLVKLGDEATVFVWVPRKLCKCANVKGDYTR
jgi:hypothetical protein